MKPCLKAHFALQYVPDCHEMTEHQATLLRRRIHVALPIFFTRMDAVKIVATFMRILAPLFHRHDFNVTPVPTSSVGRGGVYSCDLSSCYMIICGSFRDDEVLDRIRTEGCPPMPI